MRHTLQTGCMGCQVCMSSALVRLDWGDTRHLMSQRMLVSCRVSHAAD